MNRIALLTTTLLAAAVLPAALIRAEEEDKLPVIEDLAWMAGTWRAESGPMPFEEHWTAPWGGTMVAVSRGLNDGKTSMVELSSIEAVDGGLVLHLRHFNAGLKPWDSEKDGPLTWAIGESADNRVVFSNAERKFPRDLTYEREGDTLRATLAGERGGQPSSMTFELKRVGK